MTYEEENVQSGPSRYDFQRRNNKFVRIFHKNEIHKYSGKICNIILKTKGSV